MFDVETFKCGERLDFQESLRPKTFGSGSIRGDEALDLFQALWDHVDKSNSEQLDVVALIAPCTQSLIDDAILGNGQTFAQDIEDLLEGQLPFLVAVATNKYQWRAFFWRLWLTCLLAVDKTSVSTLLDLSALVDDIRECAAHFRSNLST